jgi:HlyD family secretion protein
MKMKKFIYTFLALVILASVFYIYFYRTKQKAITWKTATVEKGDIAVTVTATGSINALTTVQVGTQVSGTISKLLVDFNSVVKKGQIVALIDTTLLSASKNDAEATLQKATVQVNQMKIEFERVKKLFEGSAVAQADYDLANTNLESAKSTLRSAQALYDRAKINLQYATIRAPISGVVISRNVDVGQTVISSFNSPTLFTIANDLTKMQVFANVDEADIGQIKVGQKVSFTVDAYPNRPFSGEVKQVRLQPNLIQNVVNYIVVIDVPNPDLKLLPGLTANITFRITEHKNILKVLTNALAFIPPQSYLETAALPDSVKLNEKNNHPGNLIPGGHGYIWIKDGDVISPHPVTIGLVEGGYAEILGDVKEKDEVALGVSKEESTTKTKNPFMPTFRPGTRNPPRKK